MGVSNGLGSHLPILTGPIKNWPENCARYCTASWSEQVEVISGTISCQEEEKLGFFNRKEGREVGEMDE